VAVYAVTVATTECLMILAAIICTLILCFIVKMGRTYVDEAAESLLPRLPPVLAAAQEGRPAALPKKTFERLWDSRYHCRT